METVLSISIFFANFLLQNPEDADTFFNPDTYERAFELTTSTKQNSPQLDDKHSEHLSDSDWIRI